MALWGFTEDHQVAISDRFLTWGWRQAEQQKVTPIGNLKGFGKTQGIDKNGMALLVEMAVPRTSYHMYSIPVAHQWLNYFDDQCRFVKALPPDLREQLLVRLYLHDYGWCQRQRWKDRFPSIRLDDGHQPIASLISKSRLYISSYNATTYLESLSLNIPTIMFWNPEHWELRDSAIPAFEKLKSVGIFHETPESAAHQMTRVWNDIDAWWQNEATQRVRREFCEIYAHLPEHPLDFLVNTFRDVVAEGALAKQL
jgi:putative transferase (TIGR04331 family)